MVIPPDPDAGPEEIARWWKKMGKKITTLTHKIEGPTPFDEELEILRAINLIEDDSSLDFLENSRSQTIRSLQDQHLNPYRELYGITEKVGKALQDLGFDLESLTYRQDPSGSRRRTMRQACSDYFFLKRLSHPQEHSLLGVGSGGVVLRDNVKRIALKYSENIDHESEFHRGLKVAHLTKRLADY